MTVRQPAAERDGRTAGGPGDHPGGGPADGPAAGLTAAQRARGALQRLSMRARLLLGILLPVGLLLALNTASIYRQAQHSADIAYDRTLLASAKAIGELLAVTGPDDAPRLLAQVPYAALEAFEADNRSRMYYRVTGFQGEHVSGFDDLPVWRGRIPDRGIYAALVDFYDDRYRGQPVRVAVLLQPVASTTTQGTATIQVAETLELRQTLARQMLIDTLWRQALLMAVIAAVVVAVVHWVTRPVRRLSAAIVARGAGELAPLAGDEAPRELRPLVAATNDALQRQARLLAHQKRFVRDASHQLRTPLAVLKVQLQSALRGDLPAREALLEMGHTVDGATRLANQMLALAKVEQLRQQGEAPVLDWAAVVREVALDLAPLAAARNLDFELDVASLRVRAHDWSLRELARNLLHNAIRVSPEGAPLSVRLAPEAPATDPAGSTSTATGERGTPRMAVLTVIDHGPGIAEALRPRLMQPFARGDADAVAADGAGLGLAICREIVASLDGRLALDNRVVDDRIAGLAATVCLPIVDNRPP